MSYEEPLLGFRKWNMDWSDNELYSCTGDSRWHPGVNHAECRLPAYSGGCVSAPGKNCHCGFNAWFSLRKAENSYSGILGAIAGAGNIQVHRDGFRSSQAQIIAFFVPEHQAYDHRRASEFARVYGVPVFDDEQEFLSFVRGYAKTYRELKIRRPFSRLRGARSSGPGPRIGLFPLVLIVPNLITLVVIMIFSGGGITSPGGVALLQESYYKEHGKYPKTLDALGTSSGKTVTDLADGIGITTDYNVSKNGQKYKLSFEGETIDYTLSGDKGVVETKCEGDCGTEADLLDEETKQKSREMFSAFSATELPECETDWDRQGDSYRFACE